MDKFQTLLEKATDADKVELKIHKNAQVACLKSYNDEPSAARQKDLKSARVALDELVNRLWGAYFPEDDAFETVKEALAYLRAKGYKIAPSKFYADLKPKGKRPPLVPRQKDGAFLKRDLLLYAKSLTYMGDPAAGLDQAQRRKLELETRKLEKQTQLLTHELKVKEAKFIPREEAELNRAAALSIIEANVKNLHMTHAGRWIALADGDPATTAKVISAMGLAFADLFTQMSKTNEYKVNH
jgi:hypothetical protein